MISYREVSSSQPQVKELITSLAYHYLKVYKDSENMPDFEGYTQSENSHYFAAFSHEQIVGLGMVQLYENYGEMKRLFVDENYRGQGIAKKLYELRENFLKEKGIFLSRIETGIHQVEALNLFRSLGYTQRDEFGDYLPGEMSIFFEKRLV